MRKSYNYLLKNNFTGFSLSSFYISCLFMMKMEWENPIIIFSKFFFTGFSLFSFYISCLLLVFLLIHILIDKITFYINWWYFWLLMSNLEDCYDFWMSLGVFLSVTRTVRTLNTTSFTEKKCLVSLGCAPNQIVTNN